MQESQGKAIVATLLTFAAWGLLGESGRRKVGEFINNVLAAAEQQRIVAQSEAAQRLAEARQAPPILEATAKLVPGPDVSLITVYGGGHTIPHPTARFPRIFGRVNQDFSAAEEAWRFFRSEMDRRRQAVASD